jgi:hypothetical protein
MKSCQTHNMTLYFLERTVREFSLNLAYFYREIKYKHTIIQIAEMMLYLQRHAGSLGQEAMLGAVSLSMLN